MKNAAVTDSNNRPAGFAYINLVTTLDNVPYSMAINNVRYYATGKKGTSMAQSPSSAPAGLMMWEMATADDARAWVDADGLFVHLD